MSTNGMNEETTLVFFDNFIYQSVQYSVEEIFFNNPITLQQIRILKPDSNPHTKLKSMVSITQKEKIIDFEIFGRNLKKSSDKFETLFKCQNINTDNGQTDSIFLFYNEFVTNHIVFRGKFEKITMCIYGTPYEGNDKFNILENAKNDIDLEKIEENLWVMAICRAMATDTSRPRISTVWPLRVRVSRRPTPAVVSAHPRAVR